MFFFDTNFFKKYKKIYNAKTTLYLVDKINFIDIDDKFTFEQDGVIVATGNKLTHESICLEIREIINKFNLFPFDS